MASRTWVRFNDDARAISNREKHIKQNGGSFVKNDRPPFGLKWQAEEKKIESKTQPKAAQPKTDTKKKSKKK